jgi:hypothetical protein
MFSIQSVKNYIFKYVRDKNRNRIGVVAAFLLRTDKNDVVVMGWSVCNKLDKFNRKRAIGIAADRAIGRLSRNKKLYDPKSRTGDPVKIKKEYEFMQERATHYFKNCRIIA